MRTTPYLVISETKDSVVVGFTDFMEIFKDAPDTLLYKDKVYVCGPGEAIPRDLAGRVCSARCYNLHEYEKEACHAS